MKTIDSIESEISTLDLHMEILRIVHHNPGSKSDKLFSLSTLAMDENSFTEALNLLIKQKLIKVSAETYKLTTSGINSLMPQMSAISFPSGKISHVQIIKPEKKITSLIVQLKNDGSIVLNKEGIKMELSETEQRQLFQKLERDFSF